MKKIFLIVFVYIFSFYFSQNVTGKVNVFLGSSGDHGQMSPAASYPFSMLSIGPQTYPHLHAGYEYKAKQFLGFTQTRMEGVGCMGSGGNFLLKPILNGNIETDLIKSKDDGGPGFYNVDFQNGISVRTAVSQNSGTYEFDFPQNASAGFTLDLSHAFVNRFVKCDYQIKGNRVLGYADTKTTCDQGVYRIYFCFLFEGNPKIEVLQENKLAIKNINNKGVVRIGLSAVNENYAEKRITNESLISIKEKATTKWNELLGRAEVHGNKEDEDLFYSLLYRTLQSPYLISENDGTYRATDGTLQYSKSNIYHGWAVWDNYHEQYPLLSIIYPDYYKDIILSLADTYFHGKTQWSTQHSPSLTVRTEHSIVLMLEAINKGIPVPADKLILELEKETEIWDRSTPDKALEAFYDDWAASEIFQKIKRSDLAKVYRKKAMGYKDIWIKNFKDITAPDADKMAARGMYQGTVWQYRWLVPYDIFGLKKLIGSDEKFISELDTFFEKDYYNHANETDIQVPSYYNATSVPWKSQRLIRKLLKEDVIQYYFNDNSRGIDPYIGRIYQNKPEAYLRTMDDDAGAMSSWWVLRSLGFSTANAGDAVFYLNAPIFNHYKIHFPGGKTIYVSATNQSSDSHYINSISMNGNKSMKNWLNYTELMNSQILDFNLSEKPNENFGVKEQWVSSL